MLRDNIIYNYANQLWIEFEQATQEGKDVSGISKEIALIDKMDVANPNKINMAVSIYDTIQRLPIRDYYTYIEPNELDKIKKERPNVFLEIKDNEKHDDELIFDKIYGAWLGRCIGCLLGMPFEDWNRNRMLGFLRDTNNYPINYYASSDVNGGIKRKYSIKDIGTGRFWINNIIQMPEDDDINYSIICLNILEQYGTDFTHDDVAEVWLNTLPINRSFTAERITLRNIIMGIFPPYSANYRNPYREWIGAQIRADVYGYVTPGHPDKAAEFAWRDASISHVKNGIYGSMFIASMISAAGVISNIKKIINTGLSQIPKKCRLAEKINDVIIWYDEGLSWEQAIDRIHSTFDEGQAHDRIHTISNAMLVCIGLLYGNCNFEESIGIAVSGGLDTDCNGATVGSIVGLILGAKRLPSKWVEPLRGKVESRIEAAGLLSICDLAKRTLKILKQIKGAG